jgi:hypothetical protein
VKPRAHVERYTFGHAEHVALSLMPCAGTRGGEPVRAAAARYIKRGWAVVPLRPRDKKCLQGHDDWLTRSYTPFDFAPTQNIGIKSVSGLVDIDSDCAEAVLMAEAFQPKTPVVYGRASRRRSHRLFRCPEITEPLTFRDLIENKNILEVRVKHQSMAPPSVHPEGELVEWESTFTDTSVELAVDRPVLLRAVRLTATGVMMARYYNPAGARHEWGLALAGTLRRFGLNQYETETLFKHAAEWARDHKVKDRLDAVRGTYARDDTSPTTGSRTLADLMGDIGKAFVDSLFKIWGETSAGVSQSVIDELNQKHAVLFDQGGNFVVLTEEVEDGKFQLRFSDPSTMSQLYPQLVKVGVTSTGKQVMKKLGAAWLDHPKRRFYNGIELAPKGSKNRDYYNLWRGWPVEPKRGTYPLFLEHLDLVAQHNKNFVRYITAWMADCVQHPEKPGGIALAFKGLQGTGKSTFAKWFGELFGAHFLHLDSEHRLLGNFNAHLHNAIVVLADEAVWAGGKQGLGALKRMITETTLNIERKGVDVLTVKNLIHMLIASNADWVVPVGFDNRRFAVFEVSDERQNDWRFFGAVERELKQGGLAALLYDLLQHPGDVDLRDIPDTDAAREQKDLSAPPIEQWWSEVLHQGSFGGNASWPDVMPSDGIQAIYTAFLDTHRMGGRSPRATQTQLAIFLRKNTGLAALRTRPASWRVPPLGECRQAWATRCRWPKDYDWGDEDQRGLPPF